MPYTISLSNGQSLISIPDQTILGPLEVNLPSNCSLNLVGRGSTSFGLPTATNFVWLLENFSNATPPVSPLYGQIWYSNSQPTPTLRLFNASGKWVQIATSDAPFNSTNSLTVLGNTTNTIGDSATLGSDGTITLIRNDYKPKIIFEGVANSTNAVTFVLSTDKFGNPDMAISTAVLPAPGNIWHDKNLNPFDINGNNVITGDNVYSGNGVYTGYNIFTKPTHFSEIIIDNSDDSAITDIKPGIISLKNIQQSAVPYIEFVSNNPASQDLVTLSYQDPNVVFSFYNGPTPTCNILLQPDATIFDSNLTHTLYHTGNLAPLVQVAANQNLQGNLNLIGASNLVVSGTVTGEEGGAFLQNLTLNGHTVLTQADIGSLPYLPLSGGTLSGKLYADGGIVLNNSLGIRGVDSTNLIDQDQFIFFLGTHPETDTNPADVVGFIQLQNSSGGMFFGLGPTGSGPGMFLDTGGNLTATGDISAYSDAKLKKNVKPIKNALALVKKLEGVRYTKIDTNSEHIGFIAQDVLPVVPEIVTKGQNGLLSLAYGNAMALCVNAIKELLIRIEELEKK